MSRFHQTDRAIVVQKLSDSQWKSIYVMDSENGVDLRIDDKINGRSAWVTMSPTECKNLIAMLQYRLKFAEREE